MIRMRPLTHSTTHPYIFLVAVAPATTATVEAGHDTGSVVFPIFLVAGALVAGVLVVVVVVGVVVLVETGFLVFG